MNNERIKESLFKWVQSKLPNKTKNQINRIVELIHKKMHTMLDLNSLNKEEYVKPPILEEWINQADIIFSGININKGNIMETNTNQATLTFKLDESLTPEQHKIIIDAVTNKYVEMIEAVKPKLDCYKDSENCFKITDNSGISAIRLNHPAGGLTGNGQNYNCFKYQEDAARFAKQRQIFDALANFSAENDPREKDRTWDVNNNHWCIIGLKVDYASNYKHIITVYFSTEELAQSALEMLKRNELI